MRPDFQGDLLAGCGAIPQDAEGVIFTFNFGAISWSQVDVSARYRPLEAPEDVILGTGATYHSPGTLESLGLAVWDVVLDTSA